MQAPLALRLRLAPVPQLPIRRLLAAAVHAGFVQDSGRRHSAESSSGVVPVLAPLSAISVAW